MAFDYASIGLRIKHARTKNGISQDKLAEALEISRNHLSQVEIGEKGISLEMLVATANILNVPISELLADSLTGPDALTDTDLHYILLDCTKQEEKIITKTAKALKAALLENGV